MIRDHIALLQLFPGKHSWQSDQGVQLGGGEGLWEGRGAWAHPETPGPCQQVSKKLGRVFTARVFFVCKTFKTAPFFNPPTVNRSLIMSATRRLCKPFFNRLFQRLCYFVFYNMLLQTANLNISACLLPFFLVLRKSCWGEGSLRTLIIVSVYLFIEPCGRSAVSLGMGSTCAPDLLDSTLFTSGKRASATWWKSCTVPKENSYLT